MRAWRQIGQRRAAGERGREVRAGRAAAGSSTSHQRRGAIRRTTRPSARGRIRPVGQRDAQPLGDAAPQRRDVRPSRQAAICQITRSWRSLQADRGPLRRPARARRQQRRRAPTAAAARRRAQPCSRRPSGSTNTGSVTTTSVASPRKRIQRVQRLALALAPAGDQRERDRLLERRAEVGRGDVAEHRHRRRGAAGSATIWAPLRIGERPSCATRPTSCSRPGSVERRPLERGAPDIVLVAARHAAEAEIGGRGAAVELGAGDVALLDPERAHRLGAVGHDAVAPRRPRAAPARPAVP